MIFGKRQVVLAALVLCLGAAVYLNWQFGNRPMDATDALDTTKTLGDAQLVDSPEDTPTLEVSAPTKSAVSSYFDDARKSREDTREEALEILNETIENVKLSSDEKSAAISEQAELAARIEREGNIENLVKAKGFSDCVATIGDSDVTVIVPSDKLSDDQIIQITDIVLDISGMSSENIRIIPVK